MSINTDREKEFQTNNLSYKRMNPFKLERKVSNLISYVGGIILAAGLLYIALAQHINLSLALSLNGVGGLTMLSGWANRSEANYFLHKEKENRKIEKENRKIEKEKLLASKQENYTFYDPFA